MLRTSKRRRALICGLCLLGLPAVAAAQPEYSQRGYVEWRGFYYPQEAGENSAHSAGLAYLRFEGAVRFNDNWNLLYGLEGAADSQEEVRRDAGLFWFDRSLERPAAALRRLSLQYTRGGWRLEAGKQVIRWGQADLWSPSDRFAPRDLLYPLEPDYLAVTGIRASYGRSGKRLEAVYVPRFTPSRLPLPQRRWLRMPPELEQYPFRDIGNLYPGGGQAGLRFTHSFRQTDYGLSYFEGFNHTPSVVILYNPFTEVVKLRRDYPRIRMLGGDVSRTTRWFIARGEAGLFRSPTPFTDDYIQWVVEAERTQGPVTFVGGYVGESITTMRAKNRLTADRSFTDLFLGKLLWSVNARSIVRLDLLLRRSGDAYGMQGEYSRRIGDHWRVAAGGAWLGGDPAAAIGQYRTNSNLTLGLRYSF